MKIITSIGDSKTKFVGDVIYENAQIVNFLYVITGDRQTASNYQQIEALHEDQPLKKTYEELASSYSDSGLVLMNYNAGGRIYDSIPNYRQYGIMTIPSSSYTSAISIYKKEIWYEMVDANEDGKIVKKPKAVEENNWHLVTNKSENGTIYDFNVANNRYYKYLFRFVHSTSNVNEKTLAEELKEIIIPIRVGWKGWTLTELHEVENVAKEKYADDKVYTASRKDVWRFKYNISPGDVSQDLAKTAQDTLSQFPKFIHGPKNTMKGQVTCLLGRDVQPFDWQTITYSYGRDNPDSPTVSKDDWKWQAVYNNLPTPRTVDGFAPLNDTQGGPFHPHPRNQGGYTEELWPDVYYSDRTSNKQLDLLYRWQDFCYSGNPKLLKDQVGNKYIVQIHDTSSHVEEGWEKRPITITFSWTQIGDATNCQILEES